MKLKQDQQLTSYVHQSLGVGVAAIALLPTRASHGCPVNPAWYRRVNGARIGA